MSDSCIYANTWQELKRTPRHDRRPEAEKIPSESDSDTARSQSEVEIISAKGKHVVVIRGGEDWKADSYVPLRGMLKTRKSAIL